MQGIYAIRHKASKRCYVGSSINVELRWKQHRNDLRAGEHHSAFLQRAWTKHGEESFEFVLLEDIDVSLNSIRVERENYWIEQLNASFNVAPVAGSTTGLRYSLSAEARQRLSDANVFRGQKRPAETVERMSAAQKKRFENAPHHMKGVKRVFSEETKARMSAAAKARYARGDSLKPWPKGKSHSAETKAKMSAAQDARSAAKATAPSTDTLQ